MNLTLEEKKAIKRINRYQEDWNLFAKEILNVDLDHDQKEILSLIQNNSRVSIRSGHARGKDFVTAVAALCFLILNKPSKVIMTAPTGRQVSKIMLAEMKRLYKNSTMPLGGRLMNDGIKMTGDDTWFLVGFKTDDTHGEGWTGYHSPNIAVFVTEASGLPDTVFNAIEGVLQNNSRLVLAFNPVKTKGEAYESTLRDSYKSVKLNCLNAPNVLNYKKYLEGKITYKTYKSRFIPGQVDYEWVKEKIDRPGWTVKIDEPIEPNDFEFEGQYYRPEDLFKMKVLGEFPDEDEDSLIPATLLEGAFEKYEQLTDQELNQEIKDVSLKVGVDIAGMGRDQTVFAERRGMIVTALYPFASKKIKKDTIHMEVAGKIVNTFNRLKGLHPTFYIDTMGEGAGVYSRLREQEYSWVVSAKATFSATNLTDSTKNFKFVNMRAYMYWRLREELQKGLAIPRNNQLAEELTKTKYEFTSNGKIKIEDKDEIKKRIGRSPDFSDALVFTYFPAKKTKKSDGTALKNLI